jgi:hypothetical protein
MTQVTANNSLTFTKSSKILGRLLHFYRGLNSGERRNGALLSAQRRDTRYRQD